MINSILYPMLIMVTSGAVEYCTTYITVAEPLALERVATEPTKEIVALVQINQYLVLWLKYNW